MDNMEIIKFLITGNKNTDTEILMCIMHLAENSEDAYRILTSPTREEIIAIEHSVTANGKNKTSDYQWADFGYTWAENKPRKFLSWHFLMKYRPQSSKP